MAADNHVIFLGAGASYTSGYPLGEELRRMLCSPHQIVTALIKNVPQAHNAEPLTYWRLHGKPFQAAIDMFRHGGFGTVDEYSKLVASHYPVNVHGLRQLMRIPFLIHNPEDKFDYIPDKKDQSEPSDYYPFIQRLFQNDLRSLKPNITIISYNYDCYLDFLLLRAYKTRNELRPGFAFDEHMKNRLTSGFFNISDTVWADRLNGFGYFKLHGSIAYPRMPNDPTWADKEPFHLLFKTTAQIRYAKFFTSEYLASVPPVIFPWEVFPYEDAGSDDTFIDEGKFIFVASHQEGTEEREHGRYLYRTYRKVWEKAREAVTAADKISFVGLSMHPFLEQGLRRIFKDRTKGAQIVIANPDNKRDGESPDLPHGATLCGRVKEMLRSVAPNLKFRLRPETIARGENTQFTLRNTFSEFIQRDMD